MTQRVVVLGGAGAMGRITVRDLVETAPDFEVVIADFDLPAAKKLVRDLKHRKLTAVAANASNEKSTAKGLQGASVVVNATHHRFNLSVMRAALEAGCHYVDLGGLFHVTKKQLALDRDFKRAGLTALLGMGAAPGITNLLARSAADALDEVRAIHLFVGSVDETPLARSHPLASSYTLETILEEFTQKPAVFTNGRMTFVPPLSGAIDVDFPEPIGTQRPMFTIHSEVLQLSRSFRKKGVKEVSFRIAFEPEWTARLAFLRELGLTSAEPLEVRGEKISPRDVLLALVKKIPPPMPAGPLKQHEVLRAVVEGTRDGNFERHVVDCHCTGAPDWGIGLDLDTGAPPSIAAQMLARGEIRQKGAVNPEVAVPVAPFFAELQARGMWLTHSVDAARSPAPRKTRQSA